MVRSLLMTAMVAVPLISHPAMAGGGEANLKPKEVPHLTKKQKALRLASKVFGCCVPFMDLAGEVIPGQAGQIIGDAGDVLEDINNAIKVSHPVAKTEEERPKFIARQKAKYKAWKAKRQLRKQEKEADKVRSARVKHFGSRHEDDDVLARR